MIAARRRRRTGAIRARDPNIGDGVKVFLFEEGAQRRLFDAAIIEATEAIIADAAMIADSDRWFRDSEPGIEAHRDGPTLDAAGLRSSRLLFARTFPVSPETSHQGLARSKRAKCRFRPRRSSA